ncbi:MAG: hypothetical protein AAFU79_00470 [Myxococcota bacterium]
MATACGSYENESPSDPGAGGALPGGAPTQPPPDTGATCDVAIDSPDESFYSQETFTQILPSYVSPTCLGCHASTLTNPFGDFKIWADALVDPCSRIKQFNENERLTDLEQPEQSRIYTIMTDPGRGHPIQWAPGSVEATGLLGFIQAASDLKFPVGAPPPPADAPPPLPAVGASTFDYAVYASTINGFLDAPSAALSCSAAACHGGPNGIAGFRLNPGAQPGSREMEENFLSVTALAATRGGTADEALIYRKATIQHSGSNTLSNQEAAAFSDFIIAGNESPLLDCANPANYDAGVFGGEIAPILFGDVDYNDLNVNRNQGCSRQACHGNLNRQGGALVLSEALSPAENLAAFLCFVNEDNPPASDILLCATDSPGCSRPAGHPGRDVFSDPSDENYRRVLSFILASRNASTPIDFSFFAAAVNPLFSDQSVIENGSTLTCDNNSCHGVSVFGQSAPGGSNLPLIANAGNNPNAIEVNFNAAKNFTNFANPLASSIFLYPTNEIADPNNRFATGLAHPGGEVFAADSESALTLLRWAGGLRADEGDGAVLDWLVAGDFGANDINDRTALQDEEAVYPKFGDIAGGLDNGGLWTVLTVQPDGDAGVAAEIDLDTEFGDTAVARVLYAATYLINLSGNPLQVRMSVTSPNEVRVYADQNLAGEVAPGASATVFLNVPPFSLDGRSVRVLLKIFQDPDLAAQALFSATLEDADGQPLDANDGRIVVKLGPEKGRE